MMSLAVVAIPLYIRVLQQHLQVQRQHSHGDTTVNMHPEHFTMALSEYSGILQSEKTENFSE